MMVPVESRIEDGVSDNEPKLVEAALIALVVVSELLASEIAPVELVIVALFSVNNPMRSSAISCSLNVIGFWSTRSAPGMLTHR